MGIWGLSHCFWGRGGVILQTGNAPRGAFGRAFRRFRPRQRRNGFAKARRTSKKATHPRGPWGRAPLWGAGQRQGGAETQPPEDKRCCRGGAAEGAGEARQGGRRDEDTAGRTRRPRRGREDAGVLKPAPPPKIKTAEAGAPCGAFEDELLIRMIGL